jgi:hypothetical protein
MNSLTLLIVIALMGIIVVVLILPDVDLPDTAFQRNSSLQALQALSHQVLHTSANAGSLSGSFPFVDASVTPRQVHDTRAQRFDDLPIHHKTLRC